MKLKTLVLVGFIILVASCSPQENKTKDMKYTSAITFLYYEDFNYGMHFEDVLGLKLVMNQDFARVYDVNQKAFLGMVKKKAHDEASGNTLFSLTTKDVDAAYKRVRQLEVYNLTEVMHFESIPLKSFFFEDKEGHKFEIQQFLDKDDVLKF